jgi:hypothetical protein
MLSWWISPMSAINHLVAPLAVQITLVMPLWAAQANLSDLMSWAVIPIKFTCCKGTVNRGQSSADQRAGTYLHVRVLDQPAVRPKPVLHLAGLLHEPVQLDAPVSKREQLLLSNLQFASAQRASSERAASEL